MTETCVLLEMTGSIAVLKVNRPENMNVLNSEVIERLGGFLSDLDRDNNVKVVILTGAGEKAFIAGGDVKEMVEMDPLAARAFSRKGQSMVESIAAMRKPVIAAVNGYAFGGGLEIALACDFIYASGNAKLGLPEASLGVIPGWGGTQNLPRLVGPNKARELIFTGRILTARQAQEWGIVNEVFPPEELLAKVMEVAETIARQATLALAADKDAINNGLNMSRQDGLRYESSMFSALFSTEDQKEGMRAFVAKRKPDFKGI